MGTLNPVVMVFAGVALSVIAVVLIVRATESFITGIVGGIISVLVIGGFVYFIIENPENILGVVGDGFGWLMDQLGVAISGQRRGA